MAPGDTARLFLALQPPPAVQAALAAQVAAWRWPADAAVYAAADWHLTLHFIGPVSREQLPGLRTGLALPMQPFTLRLGTPALWPHGLAVLLPRETPPPLRALHEQLAQRLQGLGLRLDARPYRPHLTLARRAQGACAPPEPLQLDWAVTGYALMESTGRPAARYQLVQPYGTAEFV